MPIDICVGIDFGTSGCRLCAIDANKPENIVFEARKDFLSATSPQPGWYQQDPNIWWQGFISLLKALAKYHERSQSNILSLSIDGTSGTLIACDRDG